ncbi:hypothetical protein W1080910_171 [Cyanophage S-RIM12 isolate W1_08_0910]|uniref:Uncharacterized protein n=2 Tax=Brizovirus TaxID=2733098 RepID=A0A1D7SSF4_9CAUD|nr:hypothetical protein HOQ65_gp065 [Cyanophage S-RIM12 isolate RW_06_0310]YP_009779580.1 hypothetical protein HOQ66_gp065 [Cyanophage S-RIM12 isolate W1_08_0910]AOO16513.1 hypothetical protein RW060310_171 [Cyanophage S-RIM12 isolate RW_06_0310]AOO18662.1 hypothetical protein W1080910_171 [Cyanophage S-RIM12 isolate W1_08_0910]
MLSFKALSERKTKVKINPRQSEITEKECGCDDKKKKKCPKCDGKGCKHCGGTGYHDEDGDGADMSEAKKKDDSYLEVNFKKRQKNNEKARKEMDKVPGQKNPHFESKENSAYVSQEEVSEESTEEVAETETLLTFGQFDELYKGKHGQSEKQYQDSRSDAGKMVSGDSKSSGSRYAQGRRTSSDAGPQPAGGSKKPESQGKMDSGSRTDLTFRKAALKKKAAAKNEEVVNEEGADSLKDRRMERGGVDGNTNYRKPPAKKLSNAELGIKPGKTQLQKDADKKYGAGTSAMDRVKADIAAKYGKGAIMDTKKKK